MFLKIYLPLIVFALMVLVTLIILTRQRIFLGERSNLVGLLWTAFLVVIHLFAIQVPGWFFSVGLGAILVMFFVSYAEHKNS